MDETRPRVLGASARYVPPNENASGGGLVIILHQPLISSSVPYSNDTRDQPEEPPPAYQQVTSSSASAYPPNTGVSSYNSQDSAMANSSETEPPSYGFVTQSGMQQFQNDLPPPSNQKDVVVESSDDACGACFCMCFAFLGHVGFFTCLLLLVREAVDPTGNDWVVPLCATFLVVSYFVIIIESGVSNTRKYISKCVSLETLHQFIDELKNQRPMITWHVECYHYETRYRTVSYTDSSGRIRYKTESYQKKVVTHTDKRDFDFTRWRDVSKQMPAFERGIVTRLQFTKSYGFMDSRSKEVYDAWKTEFHDENVNRDRHMSFYEDYHIEGFKGRMSAYINKESRRRCMEERYFWLTTLLLVNPLYRCWYSSVTSKTMFNVAKEVGL